MLNGLVAHAGRPPLPHDLWWMWNLEPLLFLSLLSAGWAYRRGHASRRRRGAVDSWRARAFAAALVTIAVALISPLDALSAALASAHMVQHVLLVLVAAPLLALSSPVATMLRGSPPALRQASVRWRRRYRLTRANLGPFRQPGTVWLLHVGALWFWHASVPYGAALDNELLHIVEHATFLGTAVLFWSVVVGTRSAGRVSNGLGVLLVFGMAMQSVFLSALLTFARTPWYDNYATTTTPWGFAPLADQQLAGAIMWIPAGLVYVGVALTLLALWIQASERDDVAVTV